MPVRPAVFGFIVHSEFFRTGCRHIFGFITPADRSPRRSLQKWPPGKSPANGRRIALSIGQEASGILLFFLRSIGILDRGFCLLELRNRNPDLEGAPGIQVEKMILAPDGPVRNAFLVEQFAEFRMNARIVPLPKGAKRVLRIFRLRTCCARSAQSTRGCGGLIHQINIAIGASRESLPVLRFALGANHGAWAFTTKG